MTTRKSWYSSGKLLITGEYLVLAGAKALAFPLKTGQHLTISENREKKLHWRAIEPDGLWFQCIFNLPDLEIIYSPDRELCEKLKNILSAARALNPDFLENGENGFEVDTILEFNPEYGLGSSSTLLNNLAGWAGIDPFKLQKLTFEGSGYDIACASAKKPLIYQLVNQRPVVTEVNFSPPFKDNLYFVYSGRKQRTSESLLEFKKASFDKTDITIISEITEKVLETKSFDEFEYLLIEHENLMSKILNLPKAKDRLFPDHRGTVKSLGAWGGDFMLMTFRDEPGEVKRYLNRKGFDVFYRYEEIVLI
ncbi:MAG: GHMP kinase [Chlorobi bacterium]|nr:GHMP kinase [Chlorobiota bacterium]